MIDDYKALLLIIPAISTGLMLVVDYMLAKKFPEIRQWEEVTADLTLLLVLLSLIPFIGGISTAIIFVVFIKDIFILLKPKLSNYIIYIGEEEE